MWLFVTTLLSLLSGWFTLMNRFPDRPVEEETLRIRPDWASMGVSVSMRGVVRLGVCRSGLRVGMMRLLGPFARDFLVPWDAISVTRGTTLFEDVAVLRFGNPPAGSIKLSVSYVDRLARAAESRWPERGPFPVEPKGRRLRRTLIGWAVGTSCIAVFFITAPMLTMPEANRPPIALAILVPTALFVVATVVAYIQYLGE
jgi:hypothetical protein